MGISPQSRSFVSNTREVLTPAWLSFGSSSAAVTAGSCSMENSSVPVT